MATALGCIMVDVGISHGRENLHPLVTEVILIEIHPRLCQVDSGLLLGNRRDLGWFLNIRECANRSAKILASSVKTVSSLLDNGCKVEVGYGWVNA